MRKGVLRLRMRIHQASLNASLRMRGRWRATVGILLLAKDARNGAPQCCSISSALRGAEAPLFHGTPSVWGLPSATSRSGSTSKTLAPNHPCPCGSDTLVRCRAEHADSPYESACAVEGSLPSLVPDHLREFCSYRIERLGRPRLTQHVGGGSQNPHFSQRTRGMGHPGVARFRALYAALRRCSSTGLHWVCACRWLDQRPDQRQRHRTGVSDPHGLIWHEWNFAPFPVVPSGCLLLAP